ncbi:tartrate-resistant acid phosphatase type 5-like [Lingula anatina]|uniref:Tartrate-resistant acid phosphatase type 5 n=1 Tax=Lingula anatina TaxID=7574 RepID=A0A1S3H424_LINAN|nr:tartrate-resistant acid phosphatase type 5-like [Lingula anatina]|eukprot:XP_013379889.1 tartrate-resistant acid phosphatase type 5-like [Lingula anatina]
MLTTRIVLVFSCMFTVAWASSSPQGLRFMTVGDFGGLPSKPYYTNLEKTVAHGMGQIAEKYQTKFTLVLGDNFYYKGVKDAHDPRFKETFENVFTHQALQTPWYVIAGNHDHNGNVAAQFEYSKLSHRWKFPTYYYPLHFTIPGSNATLSIYMLDTIVMCGNVKSDFDDEQPQGPEDIEKAEAELQWLENNLKHDRADYVIVTGHYPVISVGEHGPALTMTKKLMPLLHKYKVTSYFAGHQHSLQYLQHTMMGTAVDYFIIGCGNWCSHSKKHNDVPSGSLKFHWSDTHRVGGFGYIDATPQAMTFSFIAGDGRQVFSHTMKPRKL